MPDDTIGEKVNKIMTMLKTYGPDRFAKEIAKEDQDEINYLLRVLEEHTDSDVKTYEEEGFSLKDHHDKVMALLRDDDSTVGYQDKDDDWDIYRDY